MNDEHRRPLTISDLIEEGGRQKPVAPPKADSRPVGLTATPNSKASSSGQSQEKKQ
jgi:hypothetical protein